MPELCQYEVVGRLGGNTPVNVFGVENSEIVQMSRCTAHGVVDVLPGVVDRGVSSPHRQGQKGSPTTISSAH